MCQSSVNKLARHKLDTTIRRSSRCIRLNWRRLESKANRAIDLRQRRELLSSGSSRSTLYHRHCLQKTVADPRFSTRYTKTVHTTAPAKSRQSSAAAFETRVIESASFSLEKRRAFSYSLVLFHNFYHLKLANEMVYLKFWYFRLALKIQWIYATTRGRLFLPSHFERVASRTDKKNAFTAFGRSRSIFSPYPRIAGRRSKPSGKKPETGYYHRIKAWCTQTPSHVSHFSNGDADRGNETPAQIDQ